MKKLLALLPILLVAGAFVFSADQVKEEPKQEASKPAIQLMVDPGGGGL